ncbi:Major Facilitator Superfamily protein [Promicromonospora umidemergens]|uniref:Major facilitator superfamily (MFS) profile domain-containing protein n=1 Tax=Promicromonospora umidemergens TaxID=629679 RepID=A0ABP8X0B7_9MICO|nr:Major Facilitator Superfamily protein [Promicromonospora umidemergens]
MLFTLASVAIGLSNTATGLIGFRVAQGVAAGILMPQTLAILRATFPREKFSMAVGIWGGVSSIAIAIGPTLAGALESAFSWQSVFFINVPVAAVGLVYGLCFLPRTSFPTPGRFDVRGVIVLAVGLVATVFAIVQAETWGWADVRTLGLLAAGILVIVGFVGLESRIETRGGDALLPLSLFRGTTVGTGGLMIATNFFVLMGATFVLPMFFINLRGATGLEAGLMLLPMSAVSIVSAPAGSVLVARIGTRATAVLSLGLTTLGLLGLLNVSATSSYGITAVTLVVLAMGTGMTITAGAEAIMGSAPVHLAGVAGGFQSTCIQIGGAVGTAVMSAIVTANVHSATTTLGLGEAGLQGLAQGSVPANLDAGAATIAEGAYVSGLHAAFLVAAVVVAAVAVAALVTLRGVRPGRVQRVVRKSVDGGAAHS